VTAGCRESAGATDEEAVVTVVRSTPAPSPFTVRDQLDPGSTTPRSTCLDTCGFEAAAQWHHARLTSVEHDPDALVELLELAVTWHELEYSQSAYIPPDQWMDFVVNHCWGDPDRVARVFSVATDVVMIAGRAIKQSPEVVPTLAEP
jgi:hypothetical protein